MKILVTLLAFNAILMGCATESSRTIETIAVESKKTVYRGPIENLVVGKFDNRSSYGRGIFSNGTDKLGSQAKTILKTHLQQTGRFQVLDRANMAENAREAKLAGIKQKLKGAKVLVTGNVTEFGRKVTGDRQLFGILGSGKKQVAYAKVMLNIVDVETSSVIHSVQAAGEFNLNNREVLGFGGASGYDATLNGKVLNLAIREAVNLLISDLESGEWRI